MKFDITIYLTNIIQNEITSFGKISKSKPLETININIDPKDFLNLTEEDAKKEFINIIKNKCDEYVLDNYKIRSDYAQLCDKFKEEFLPEYNKLVLKEKAHTVYLLCYSEESDSDWYGDFNYYANPLGKYVSCTKQCETYELTGSGHGYGVAGYIVKTSKDFIEFMGWEDDLKYEITREEYIRLKNNL